MISPIKEKKLFAAGFGCLGAVDEAGRGPLAGPVVAACVMIRCGADFKSRFLKDINDSKKLSPQKREYLFPLIKNFYTIGIGIVDHKTIDRLNIFRATFLAMRRAVNSLPDTLEYILVDGRAVIPRLSIRQEAIVGGDGKILSIAAASIIAKVTRDRIMAKWHHLFPAYGFNRHQGYGTKEHFKNIMRLGPSAIHRRSFSPFLGNCSKV